MKGKRFFLVVLLIVLVAGVVVWKTKFENNQENGVNDHESGDNVNASGEVTFDKVKYVNEINSYIEEVDKNSGDRIQYNTLATTDELGSDIEEFVKNFNTEGAYSTINIVKNKLVEIIPASDFLNLQSYYYRNGELVMYRCDFIGIGGCARYYFKDKSQVALITSVEPEMDFKPEQSTSIMKRAENNYSDFFTSDFYHIELKDETVVSLGMSGDIISDIGKRVVSSGETQTDWQSIVIKNVKYDDFTIRIVNSSVDSERSVMNITTHSKNVKLPKNLELGMSVEKIEATLNRPIEQIPNLEYDSEYYDFKFDKAYCYEDIEKFNREIIFYMVEDKLVAVEMLDALDA